ncbi:HlyC/CorC family transporter [Altericroceibacterium spongiae]|uniref:HlyC/CorC family transporter n=1 Tax=Altericroceibacterium spongiae TaxID=2320269 RepID=A0A420EM15_9SPHN|nr:hemolysin family protein [Altericroceibacterium spongiae]RKF21731.1 HlyC/CorC family transporter [Altericroceibacterium spongiae]
MTLLFFYVGLALGISFLCSLLEASLLTLTPSAIQTGKTAGARWAESVNALKQDVDRPLAAILTLNTVAHTMGAAGAGAEYARLFGSTTQALFAAALTVAVLVLTEIIPKTIGARYAVALAPFLGRILPPMIWLLAPLVWFSQQLTRIITFGKAADTTQHRDELLAVARLGEEAGQIDARETAVLHNLLGLNEVRSQDVMTPRTVMFTMPETMPLRDFPRAVADKPYTRIPIHRDNPDKISGFVIKSEVLTRLVDTGLDTEDVLSDVARPMLSIPDSLSVDRIFKRFVEERHQIMLVVDEYGTVSGLLTLEDIVETIFGIEILDEVDTIADLQSYARRLWEDRAERLRTANRETDKK